jgi:hypothetical protein
MSDYSEHQGVASPPSSQRPKKWDAPPIHITLNLGLRLKPVVPRFDEEADNRDL